MPAVGIIYAADSRMTHRVAFPIGLVVASALVLACAVTARDLRRNAHADRKLVTTIEAANAILKDDFLLRFLRRDTHLCVRPIFLGGPRPVRGVVFYRRASVVLDRRSTRPQLCVRTPEGITSGQLCVISHESTQYLVRIPDGIKGGAHFAVPLPLAAHLALSAAAHGRRWGGGVSGGGLEQRLLEEPYERCEPPPSSSSASVVL
jgi:hypothetical protein